MSLTQNNISNADDIPHKSEVIDISTQQHLDSNGFVACNDLFHSNQENLLKEDDRKRFSSYESTIPKPLLFPFFLATIDMQMEADHPKAICFLNLFHQKPRWSQKPIVVAGGLGAGEGLKQLHHPNDIALDINGMLYVADYSNKRVSRWTMGVNEVVEIVAGGDLPPTSPLTLRYPRRICVTKDGSLFILDDDRVLKLAKHATSYTIISSL